MLGNVQCWGVLLTWIIVGHGTTVLAVNARGGCLDIFFSHLLTVLSPTLWEMDNYRCNIVSKCS